MTKKYIVTSTDGKITGDNFSPQVISEAGKAWGIKPNGLTGLIPVGGSSADIDDFSVKLDENGKLSTAIGGGVRIREHEELIKETANGVFVPAGTFPEVPVNVCTFVDNDIKDTWLDKTHVRFTFKSGTYQSSFDATIGHITVLGVNLVGFEVTDSVFGNIKFGHIYPSGTDDVIAVLADNHIEDVTMQILNFKRVDESAEQVPMNTSFIPIDYNVLERKAFTEHNPLTLKYPFGTWNEESSESAANMSGTPSSSTRTSFTIPIVYETGFNMEALRYAVVDVEYTLRFDSGDKCGGRIRFQFSNTFSGLIGENLVDTSDSRKVFNGGSLEITPDGNAIWTEGPHNPFDFTEHFTVESNIARIEFIPTDHKINAQYVNINNASFPIQATSEAGKVWGIGANGTTSLLQTATPFIVSFTYSSSGTWSCNKTYSEIPKSQNVYGLYTERTSSPLFNDGIKEAYLRLTCIGTNNELIFSALYVGNASTVAVLQITLTENNVISHRRVSLY